MLFSILIIIALIGAAALGFLWAWSMKHKGVLAAQEEVKNVQKKLSGTEAEVKKMTLDAKNKQTTFDKLQKENQAIETEQIQLQSDLRVKEAELQVMAREKRLLEEEISHLQEELRSNIREIAVVREVPVLENKNGQNGQAVEADEAQINIEKAKQLVKAFRKGVGETPDVKPI